MTFISKTLVFFFFFLQLKITGFVTTEQQQQKKKRVGDGQGEVPVVGGEEEVKEKEAYF